MFIEIIDKMPALLKSDDQEIALSTPLDTSEAFTLLYKKLVIGTLKLNNGVWIFTYSHDFQKQEEISPITDFPDKNKIYQTRFLFPFFASRIPSLQRLKIQNIISDNFTKNEVSLLKMFGKQSITNPYHLVYQS